MRTSVFISLLLAAVGSGVAFAASPEVSSEIEDATTLSAAAQMENADQILQEIGAKTEFVQGLLDDAIKTQDKDAQTCLVRILTPLKGSYEVSKGLRTEVRAAAGQGNTQEGAKSYRLLAIAVKRARTAASDAEQCVGAGKALEGKTVSEMGASGEDYIGADEIDVLPETPPEASPN